MTFRAANLFIFVSVLVSLSRAYGRPVSEDRAIQLQVIPASGAVGGVAQGSRSNSVTCSLDAALTSMEKITSLTIYAAQPYGNPGDLDPLATLDLWTTGPQLLNGMVPPGVAVFGHLGTGSDTKSHLTFSWSSSRNSQVTWYKCVANGLDRSGNTVIISISSDTDAETISAPGGLNRLTNTQLDKIVNSTTHLEESVQAVDTSVDFLKQNVHRLEKQVKGQNETIADLKQQMSSFVELYKVTYVMANFDVSTAYRGSQYYVSKRGVPFNIRESDALCSTFGGYLVEIDDQGEFDFVFDIVKHVGDSDYFFTGGNDLETAGDWRFWHSKKPVTFFKWAKNEPNNMNSQEHCIVVAVSLNGYNDWFCNFVAKAKFVCEVRI